MLIQITAPHFCAGLVIQGGKVTVYAPILRYMAGWTVARVEQYAGGMNWMVTRL